MTTSIFEDLMSQLQGASTDQIAQQLGTDSGTAQSAIGAALPLMLGALGKNAQQPGGAADLFQALQSDHSGSGAMDLGGLLGSLLGGGAAAAGGGSATAASAGGLDALARAAGVGGVTAASTQSAAPSAADNPQLDAGGILGHMFGVNAGNAGVGLGKATGLNASQAGNLLMLLAPVVMGMLAKHARANSMDAGGLGNMLGQAQAQQQSGVLGGLLSAVLGQNR